MRRRVVAVAVAVVLVVAAAGLLVWRSGQHSTYESALDLLPESTLRATYTDWASVRSLADGRSLSAGSSTRDVGNFLSRAFDQGLVAGSAIGDSTYALEHRLGFSPLHAAWEAYGQSPQGAVDVLAFDDSVDLAGVEGRLRTLGYDEPAGGPGSGGVWAGSADLVTALDPTLTPIQQNVVVLPDRGLVLMSDSAAYAARAAAVVRGDAPSLRSVDGVSSLAAEALSPVTATLWASDFACSDLSMGQADAEDQRVADQLVARAGGINPLSGLVMAQQDDQSLAVGMHFETSDMAKENLQPRIDLAAGPAVGQGGSFRSRFRIADGSTDGADVVLRFEDRGDAGGLLADLSEGPVLFATC